MSRIPLDTLSAPRTADLWGDSPFELFVMRRNLSCGVERFSRWFWNRLRIWVSRADPNWWDLVSNQKNEMWGSKM